MTILYLWSLRSYALPIHPIMHIQWFFVFCHIACSFFCLLINLQIHYFSYEIIVYKNKSDKVGHNSSYAY